MGIRARFAVAGIGLVIVGAVTGLPFYIFLGLVVTLISIFYDSGSGTVNSLKYPPQVWLQGPYQAQLTDAGARKINVIKRIRDMFPLSLDEVRYMIDNTPCVLKSGISWEEAEYIKAALEGEGAEVLVTSALESNTQANEQSARIQTSQPASMFQLPGQYEIILLDAGPQRSEVEWLLRAMLHFDDQAAQRVMNTSQTTIATGISLSDARRIKRALEHEGAVVNIPGDSGTQPPVSPSTNSQRIRRRNRLK